MPNDLKSRFAGSEPKFFTVSKVGGINTQAPRESIKDDQFSWLENMQPISDGNWRTLYAEGTAIFTTAKTIIYMFCAVMGGSTHALLFYSDGTADDVNLISPFTVTNISSTPNLFYPGSATFGTSLPMVAQFNRFGVVIIASNAADNYFAWDGVTFYDPGDASPSWLNGGTSTTMPTGISGTNIGVFASRVWIGEGNNLTFSAPGNGADFTTADGAGVTPSNSQFLRNEYTAFIENNGFFYLFADSSVNVISNIQTAGTGPAITTFNNQNVDPQTGTPWHNSVTEFGPTIVFANEQGVYTLSGGTATKISDDLDGIFIAAASRLAGVTSITQPTAAVAFLNDVRCYMVLLPVVNPFNVGAGFVNVLAIWDGKKWFIGSQISSLTFIAGYQFNSELKVYGTDGTHLFQMFVTPSSSLSKRWRTKLWQGDGMQVTKQALRLYSQLDDNSGSGLSVTGTADFIQENTGLQTQAMTTITGVASAQTLSGLGSNTSNVRGNFMGLTMQSTSPDFTLVNQTLLYRDESPLGG